MEDNKKSGSQQVNQSSGERWFACPKSQLIARDQGPVLILLEDAPCCNTNKMQLPLLKGFSSAKLGDKQHRYPNLRRS